MLGCNPRGDPDSADTTGSPRAADRLGVTAGEGQATCSSVSDINLGLYFFWIIIEVSKICAGMRVGQMCVQIVQFVQEYAQGKIVLEILMKLL